MSMLFQDQAKKSKKAGAAFCLRGRGEKGFTLIELLVTLLVTSFGVLGLAALQVYSLKTSQSAALQAQANILAYDMLDRMRANRTKAQNGNYNIAQSAATPSNTSTIENTDIKQWRDMLEASLPSGNGWIACELTNNTCRIDVSWINLTPADQSQSTRVITLVSRL